MKSDLRTSTKKALDEDLVEAFYKLLRANKNIAIGEIYKMLPTVKAPRFYVSFENARRYISLMARKKPISIINRNKLETYNELFRRWASRQKVNSASAARYFKFDTLHDILLEEAPSFYLDAETARARICKALRQKK